MAINFISAKYLIHLTDYKSESWEDASSLKELTQDWLTVASHVRIRPIPTKHEKGDFHILLLIKFEAFP